MDDYDYLLFSFHGVPERQIKKSDPTGRQDDRPPREPRADSGPAPAQLKIEFFPEPAAATGAAAFLAFFEPSFLAGRAVSFVRAIFEVDLCCVKEWGRFRCRDLRISNPANFREVRMRTVGARCVCRY